VKNPTLKDSTALFLFLTFGLSWLAWFLGAGPANLILDVRLWAVHFNFSIKVLLQWIGIFVPGLSALFLVFQSSDRRQLWHFLKRSFLGASSLKPSLLALVIAMSASLPTILVYRPNLSAANLVLRFLLNTAVNLALAPLWEEIGWRGFLFPRIQSAFGTLWSCLITGLIWGFWHLPLRTAFGTSHNTSRLVYFAFFCAYAGAASFVLGWLYNRARGVLLPCIVLHSAINAMSDIVDEPVMRIVGLAPLLLSTVMLALIAFFLHSFLPNQLSNLPDTGAVNGRVARDDESESLKSPFDRTT
jgi:membrane protease YdiL (CAAX protease family)